MASSIGISDQNNGQHYLMWKPDGQGASPLLNDGSSEGGALQREISERIASMSTSPDPLTRGKRLPPPSLSVAGGTAPSVTAHLAQMHEGLASLVLSRDRSERNRRHQQAIEWLSKNRQHWVGQWIALQGTQLLATGVTAKDVYAQIAGEQISPLVIKVENEELPFGGW